MALLVALAQREKVGHTDRQVVAVECIYTIQKILRAVKYGGKHVVKAETYVLAHARAAVGGASLAVGRSLLREPNVVAIVAQIGAAGACVAGRRASRLATVAATTLGDGRSGESAGDGKGQDGGVAREMHDCGDD